MKYNFPENLYTEVRIEDWYQAWFNMRNDFVEGNGEVYLKGAKSAFLMEKCGIPAQQMIWILFRKKLIILQK